MGLGPPMKSGDGPSRPTAPFLPASCRSALSDPDQIRERNPPRRFGLSACHVIHHEDAYSLNADGPALRTYREMDRLTGAFSQQLRSEGRGR